jgi:hypothetical protein
LQGWGTVASLWITTYLAAPEPLAQSSWPPLSLLPLLITVTWSPPDSSYLEYNTRLPELTTLPSSPRSSADNLWLSWWSQSPLDTHARDTELLAPPALPLPTTHFSRALSAIELHEYGFIKDATPYLSYMLHGPDGELPQFLL